MAIITLFMPIMPKPSSLLLSSSPRLSFIALSFATSLSVSPSQAENLQLCPALPTTELKSSQAVLSDADIAKLPLTVTADQAQIEGNQQIHVSGKVEIQQGPRLIKANDIIVDKNTNKLQLRGEVQVQQPGVDFGGEQAELDSVSGEVDIKTARYQLALGARGESESIQRDKQQKVLLSNGTYTNCPIGDNTWSLKASSIELDPVKGYGTAKHAQLRIKDVPIFYFPYFAFPINDQRQSGFLWPTIASSNGDVDLSTPYYFNLAENYDLTLTPRYLGERGTQIAAETRYLTKRSHWTLSGAYLDDNSSKAITQKRWLLGLNEEGQLNENWRTELNYLAVSDINYFRDLGSTGLDVRSSTLVERDASIIYQSKHWDFRTQLESYQLLSDVQTTPYTTLPRISLAYKADAFQLIQPLLFTQFTHFEDQNLPTGQRLYIEPGVQLNWQQDAGFIRPAIKLKHLQYALSSGFPSSSEATSSWQFSLDSGLYFQRFINRGGLQTLEPRIKYLYTQSKQQDDLPNFDSRQLAFSYQQLFRDTRISGYDRITDANQVSLSLTSRWLDRDGFEWANASIGQQFYFSDRDVSLPNQSNLITPNHRDQSNIVAELELKANSHLSALQELNFNPDNGNIDQAFLRTQWRDKQWNLANLGYRYRRFGPDQKPIKQLELSSAWTFNSQFSAYAAWRYDLDGHHGLEELFAIEYNNCCWRVRLAYQDELESFEQTGVLVNNSLQYQKAIFLQLELKGLGNLSNQVSSLLNESILGFKQREKSAP